MKPRAQYRLSKYYQLLVNSFVDMFLSYMYFMMLQKNIMHKRGNCMYYYYRGHLYEYVIPKNLPLSAKSILHYYTCSFCDNKVFIM